MNIKELMIGDWVEVIDSDHLKYVQVDGILNDSIFTKESEFESEEITCDNIRPVCITPAILEKNGFTNYNVGHNVRGWTIMDEEYCSDIPFTLTDNDFDTKQGDYKWGPVEDDREESFVSEIGRIKYVHELQHALKLCKIEKEIVL